ESPRKTIKYPPAFPARFGGAQDARLFCQRFFPWSNDQHRHSSLGYHTPADVHYGRAAAIRDLRAAVLASAYLAHPERFVRGAPEPPRLPEASWTNQPADEA